jgi:hypothetical protein
VGFLVGRFVEWLKVWWSFLRKSFGRKLLQRIERQKASLELSQTGRFSRALTDWKLF